MDQKQYTGSFELKADEPGSFRATFSFFNVVDRDGDVTLPGAFTPGQKVKIASWGHNWGGLTVGKGVIHTDDKRAWVDGQFNLASTAGREHYETVKFNGPDQQWSYGFQVTAHSFGEFAGREVRFLEKLDAFEVSPVMVGAGIGTRTDFIKAADDAEEGMQVDHEEKRGARLSAASRTKIQAALEALMALIEEERAEAAADDDEDEKAAEMVASGDPPVGLDAAGEGLAAGLKSYLAIVEAADADAIQRDEGAIVGVKRRLSQALDDLDRHLTRATADGPTPQALKRRFDYLAQIGPPR